jgi:SAM-dependent methyltransferase
VPTGPFEPIKNPLKRLAARLMRPGLQDVGRRLDRIERVLDQCAARLDHGGGARPAQPPADLSKYDGEIAFWRELVRGGLSERQFGQPFAALFGGWARQRIEYLGEYLGLPKEASNGAPPSGGYAPIDAWCSKRSVVEIGAGPYPSIAAAALGWKRAVAVDPLARRYVEEGLVPDACSSVVYIEAPGEVIPLPAGFADIVVNENCLDHVSDPAAVVSEMFRLLRPGGYLWLYVDLSNYSDAMHPHPMSEQSLHRLLRDFAFLRGEVFQGKAHPEAYGAYRGLWQKPAGAPSLSVTIPAQTAQVATPA